MDAELAALREKRAAGAADSTAAAGATEVAAAVEEGATSAAAGSQDQTASTGAAASAAAEGTDTQASSTTGGQQPAAGTKPAASEKTTEQQLADARAELHRMTSEIGRVSALNRKTQEQAQRIAALERQIAEATQPAQTEEDAASRLQKLADELKEYPELQRIASTVGEALKEVASKVQTTAKSAAEEVVQPLKPLVAQHQDSVNREQQAAEDAAKKQFEATYTEDAVKTAIVSDDFKTWLPKQSRALQFAFYKGESALDAQAVMDAYDAHLRRSGKPGIAQTQNTQQQQGTAGEGQDGTTASATGAQSSQQPPRNDRLGRAAGIGSRSAGSAARGSMPAQDDFEGSLAFFRSQRLQRTGAAAAY